MINALKAQKEALKAVPLAQEALEAKELSKGLKVLDYNKPNTTLISDVNQVDLDESKVIEPYSVNRVKGWVYLPKNHVTLAEKQGYMFSFYEEMFIRLGYTPVVIDKDFESKYVETNKIRMFLQGWGSSIVKGTIPEFPKTKNQFSNGIVHFMGDRFAHRKGIDNGMFKWHSKDSTIVHVLGARPDKMYPAEFKILSQLVWLARNHQMDESQLISWLKSKESIIKENGLSLIHKAEILTDGEQQIVDYYLKISNISIQLILEENEDVYVKIVGLQQMVKTLQKSLELYRQVPKKIMESRLKSVYSQKKLKKKDKERPVRDLIFDLDIELFEKEFNPTDFFTLFGEKRITLFGSLADEETYNIFWNESKESTRRLRDERGLDLSVLSLFEAGINAYLKHINSYYV